MLTLLQSRFTVRQTTGITNIYREKIIYQEKEIYELRKRIYRLVVPVLINFLLHEEEIVRRFLPAEL